LESIKRDDDKLMPLSEPLQGTAGTMTRAERRERVMVVYLTIILLLGAVLLCLMIGFRRAARRAEIGPASRRLSLYYGDTAPLFQLPMATGGTMSSNDLKGKWSLIVFAVRGCPACDRELSALAQVYARLKKTLNIIAVFSEDSSFPFTDKLVERHVKQLRLNFPVLIDRGFHVQKSYCDLPVSVPYGGTPRLSRQSALRPNRLLGTGWAAQWAGEYASACIWWKREFAGGDT
jgi:peroxiredoxin